MSVQKFSLKDKHNWKSKPGHSICVLDRGAVRFDYPSRWVVKVESGSVMLHDRESSQESCDLGVSLFPISASELEGLSLDEVLKSASANNDGETLEESPIHHVDRPGVKIAWFQRRYIEATQHRHARFRVAFAQGINVHCLITLNYWENRRAGVEVVWNEVLRTLHMDEQIQDPTVGPVVQ